MIIIINDWDIALFIILYIQLCWNQHIIHLMRMMQSFKWDYMTLLWSIRIFQIDLLIFGYPNKGLLFLYGGLRFRKKNAQLDIWIFFTFTSVSSPHNANHHYPVFGKWLEITKDSNDKSFVICHLEFKWPIIQVVWSI